MVLLNLIFQWSRFEPLGHQNAKIGGEHTLNVRDFIVIAVAATLSQLEHDQRASPDLN